MDPVLASIASAGIAAGASIVVSVINNNSQMVKIRDEQRETLNKFMSEANKGMAITDERLRNLTDEVKKHNSVIERVYKLEQSQAITDKEIEELKNDVRQIGA